ncbi:hypothetical protein AMC83_PD00282 (plasmid) [Rhizobium phaseoli]|uniref:Uncharacterized protein n=1 Tax=Rhizobium phaseoli TaxID=396 RepID=A0ABM6CIM2_9HYPH|nr:hypothetical protein AMK02_PC00286 [Rhizobium sp. N731]ANK94311.1 hypothetical protein AMK01_PB00294 [Rhizobium sp. N6212]ANL00361.1 hypothetical protein AMK00_PB00293 [Rhizobium sp. N621]ANL06483.1 hypothetical protein AMJ99_PB00286 [Rhizobium esperanzae]ANL12653.1 hypothetical protein AMJ98_PC00291 [Rhizobium sp. N1341]ANL18773.1 hypothetical protein AMJ97_PC00283 [Rhizobium sp. N1314]ANL37354.1 hypothetical protein AMC89_PC00274 [Rhizobium phaseoli]ANM37326.1 hypothetical protein AMK04
MELARRKRPADGGLMARPTHVYTINYVATLIGENLELIQEVASNSDNIDYGEMIHAHDGSEEGITTFTDRGIESLKEFLADIRTWEGGVRQFLVDEQCDRDKIRTHHGRRAEIISAAAFAGWILLYWTLTLRLRWSAAMPLAAVIPPRLP